MYFYLYNECLLVNGSTGKKIYNLLSKESLTFTDMDAKVIDELIKQKDLEEIKLENPDLDVLVNKLIQYNLGEIRENQSYSKKLNYLKTYDKILPFHLNSITIELLDTCDFNCKFCIPDNIAYISCGCKKQNFIEEPLSLNEWVDIINQAMDLGVQEIVFYGNDAFKSIDVVVKILSKIKNNKLKIVLYSNGYNINQKNIDCLSRFNIQIYLEIFGLDKMQYEQITGNCCGYEHMENALEILKKNKIETIISIVISSLNETYINDFKKKYQNEIYQFIYIFPPNAYSLKTNKALLYDTRERKLELSVFNFESFQSHNICLNKQIFVSYCGKVYPCMMLRKLELGNLKSEKLYEVFRRRDYKKYWDLSRNKIKGCKDCYERNSCFDCRAIEYENCKSIDKMCFCNELQERTKYDTEN